MKKQFVLAGLLAAGFASAQTDKGYLGKVGINIMTPQATIDIRPNDDNRQETATTNEGILIPKLSKTRVANIEDALLVEGTLVYVTDDASSTIASYAGTNAKVAKITEKGYYYYNGVEWVKVAIGANATQYTGSTSVALSGNSFQRAALTGDVTAAANSNATTIAPNAVTSAKIADGQVALADLAANSVDSSKIVDKSIVAADLNQMGATDGQVLKYNATTNTWAPAADTDTNTTYTGSTSVALSGNSFQRAALTGDVTAAANSNATTIAPNAVTSAKIADGQVALADLAANSVDSSKIVDKSIVAADLNQMGATDGQVLKYNATTNTWAPAADTDTNTTYTGSTSVALSGNSFQRAALTGDVTAAANSNATTIAPNAV
ncbi:hypothetical protein ACFFUE_02990, partial [Bergeyella porcorum]|uniref:hypothetical protein n=1 Tax=Bergeyella porcorum TaxID=1735111 RepID=UPI0035EE483E